MRNIGLPPCNDRQKQGQGVYIHIHARGSPLRQLNTNIRIASQDRLKKSRKALKGRHNGSQGWVLTKADVFPLTLVSNGPDVTGANTENETC